MVEHLREFGFGSKLCTRVLHKLVERLRQHCMKAAVLLLLFKCTKNWLKSIFTEDEKSVLYTNFQHKRSRCQPHEDPKRQPILDSIRERSYSQPGGTARACFCFNYWQATPASLRICIAKSWVVRQVIFHASA